jgi:TolA-binding protein
MTIGAPHRRTACVLGAVLLVSLAGPALAQISLDDPLDDHSAKRLDRMEKVIKELRAIVFQGRQTGQPVVVQPAQTESELATLSDHVSDLGQSVSKLNGELEVVRHDLDQARQDAADARAANAVLKEQIAELTRTQSPPPAPDPASMAAPAPEPAPAPRPGASALSAPLDALASGDMASAEAGFKDYVDRNGDGPLAPEARYYLARTLMARRAWAEAATADIAAIRGWPHTRWAPEAVLDLSLSLTALQKPADACQTLGELARRYPAAPPKIKSDAATLRLQAKCAA